jgi:hypothetical protein
MAPACKTNTWNITLSLNFSPYFATPLSQVSIKIGDSCSCSCPSGSSRHVTTLVLMESSLH